MKSFINSEYRIQLQKYIVKIYITTERKNVENFEQFLTRRMLAPSTETALRYKATGKQCKEKNN